MRWVSVNNERGGGESFPPFPRSIEQTPRGGPEVIYFLRA